METMTDPTVDPAREESASVWEDFIDIFYTPSTVFARRGDGRFVPALIILALLMTVLFYASQGVLADAMQAEFARAMEGQSLDADEMATMQRMSGIIGTAGFLITFPIGVLITGAVLWLAGKIFGSVATFAAAAMVATYAQTPKVLQQLAAIVQGMVMEPVESLYHVTISPARFADPETTSEMIMALLGRADLFVIWSVILLGIGLHVVGRIPRGQAYAAAGMVWVLGTLPLLIGSMF